MNVLIIYAHPVGESFNRALLHRIQAALESRHHRVRVADLCSERFDCAMVEEDFAQFEGKEMPADVVKEQQRFEWSDAVVFQFPFWWWSVPAILKGWFDRVMSYGWAWTDPSKPECSPLEKRKVLVVATAGASEEAFAKRGYDKAFHSQFVTGTLGYCGFNDVTVRMIHGVDPYTEERALTRILDETETLVEKLF